MNLIDRITTLRTIWPILKTCQGACLISSSEGSRPDTRHMTVMSWRINPIELTQEILNHVDRLVLQDKLSVKLATKLVGDQLGKLITLQVNPKEVDPLLDLLNIAGVDPPDKEGG